jgi:hypothetical protein
MACRIVLFRHNKVRNIHDCAAMIHSTREGLGDPTFNKFLNEFSLSLIDTQFSVIH